MAIISLSSPGGEDSRNIVAGAESTLELRRATVDGDSVNKSRRRHNGDHESVEMFAEQHLDSLFDT